MHTPGPWKVETQDWNTEKIHAERNGLVIATVSHPHGDDEAQANARLIAQAPAMLEALQDVLRYCVTVKGMPDVDKGRTLEQTAAYDKALRVIREAKGGI